METVISGILNDLRTKFNDEEKEVTLQYEELEGLGKEDAVRGTAIRAEIKKIQQNKKFLLGAIALLTQYKVSKGE